MARPIFLSYSWDNIAAIDELDAALRLRGVPVWRDRRNMRFGTYNEDRARRAIAQDCSGFAIWLTPEALASSFITQIELPAMAQRRSAQPSFLNGAVFAGFGVSAGQDALHQTTGMSISATLGNVLYGASADERPFRIRETANAILNGYLEAIALDRPAELLIDTRNEIAWAQDGDLHLNWNPPLQHDLSAVNPSCWAQHLLPALHDVRCALTDATPQRCLVVRGTPHLSAALALGYEFRRPSGWSLELRDAYGGVWSSGDSVPNLGDWVADAESGPVTTDGTLVVAVHARHDISEAIRQHRSTTGAARANLHIRPARTGADSVDPATANALAAGIAEEIRNAARTYSAAETHLYFAGPWPLSVLLGWHLASSGVVVSHEATADRRSYLTACRLT